MDRQSYTLRLNVSGRVDTGERAVSNVRRLCEEIFGDAANMLEVIDVRASPELAEEDKILATPTLVRKTPPPPRRVIGDFSNTRQVMAALAIGFPAGRVDDQLSRTRGVLGELSEAVVR